MPLDSHSEVEPQLTTNIRPELITIGDLKNWGYCARVVFYRRFLPGASAPTYKMKAGVEAQGVLEKLEVRRGLAKYGFEAAQRRFGLWLEEDQNLCMSGRLDVLLERWDDAAVVDFKLTAGEPGENHRLQLGGYALLVEAKLEIPVTMGFLVRIPDGNVFPIPIDAALRARVMKAREEIGQMTNTESLPEATEIRARCEDCEYQNYCGDVW